MKHFITKKFFSGNFSLEELFLNLQYGKFYNNKKQRVFQENRGL